MKDRFRLDLTLLLSELDNRVFLRDISWRQAGREMGIPDSTFTRMRQGHLPSLEAFAEMVVWLNDRADRFIRRGGQ